MDKGRKWPVDFTARKTHLVSFERYNNTGAIDVKMDGFVLEKKLSLMMQRLFFSSKLDLVSNVISIAKISSFKIGISLYIYLTNLHAVLLSCLGWCS